LSWIQCSQCFKIYNFDDYMKLEHEWVNKKEKKRYGKRAICGNCNAVFHKDQWRMNTLKDNYEISTVHLEIGHCSNLFTEDVKETFWYETMIFSVNKNVENPPFQVRYKTKTKAIDGHKLTVKNLDKILENPDKYPHTVFHAFERLIK